MSQGRFCVCCFWATYSKAFDRVHHKILLKKLANTGVPDCLVRWFTSFLCERRQYTKVGDRISDWCTIKAGVPQGTLFGPVGFLIYINHLQSILDITKYVDGSTVWEVCDKQGRDSPPQLAADQSSNWSVKNHI